MTSRRLMRFDEGLAEEAERVSRNATRRLKSFLREPSPGRLARFEAAAEEAQLAAGRAHAAKKLAESWGRG